MTQIERLDFLIEELIKEQSTNQRLKVPSDISDKKRLLRLLCNVRPAIPANKILLKIQDEYLKEEIENRGITDIDILIPIKRNLYLWQGDITTLKVDAVVNAANSQMLGCFIPCHGCIDNAIHTSAGIQLRLACHEIMKKQQTAEPTGQAKITSAYSLPSTYVIHTVGPIVQGVLTRRNCDDLASCYYSCLETAEQHDVKSIAFCCISTGEFHFPNQKAAEIAYETVNDYIFEKKSEIKVVFNVFKNEDYEIYRQLCTCE